MEEEVEEVCEEGAGGWRKWRRERRRWEEQYDEAGKGGGEEDIRGRRGRLRLTNKRSGSGEWWELASCKPQDVAQREAAARLSTSPLVNSTAPLHLPHGSGSAACYLK